MKKLISILFLISFIFISGCVLEYRENLPAEIVITETSEPVPETIKCLNPPCATLVQMSEIKRTEYVCSPSYKEANNDPQGVVYKTQLGDSCKALPAPTTLCLRYDCNYNPDDNIGYNEITCSYTYTSTIWVLSPVLGFPIPVTKTSHDVTRGVTFPDPDSHLVTQIGNKCNYGSLGGFSTGDGEKSFEFVFNYYSNYPEKKNIGTYFVRTGLSGHWQKAKARSKIISVFQKNCPAQMPIKYPYNAIDFAYNPILDFSETPEENKLLFNLIHDYSLLEKARNDYIFKAEKVGSDPYDPCKDICEKTTEIIDDVDVDECNLCQEERRKELEEGMKSRGTSDDKVFFSVDYLYSELNPDEEHPSSSVCTGITPCVEIDRAIPEDDQDTRYFICNCLCDAVLYTSYICNRAGDSTEYYYTSCEINNIKSDQGGYIFSIHGFEAELFKNVLSSSENKMPTFMIGQGSTFKDYFYAKEKCLPDVTADEIVVAGDYPFSPKSIDVIVDSPICFTNDGSRTRNISLNNYDNIILVLEPRDSICLDTGEDTLFELSNVPYEIFVDDNPISAEVNVINPAELDNILNTIKMNENDELRFFFNNNIELSLLYASAPRSSSMRYIPDNNLDFETRQITYGSGEFPVIDEGIFTPSPLEENLLTWIAYETGYDSMRVSERRNLYDSSFDRNMIDKNPNNIYSDGYIDIRDLISIVAMNNLYYDEHNSNSNAFIRFMVKYPYLRNIYDGVSVPFDYPIIKKGSNYFEFNPGAIILPVGSEFCVNNTMHRRIDLILERKFNPSYSSRISSYGLVDVPNLNFMQINYFDAPSNHIRSLDMVGSIITLLHLDLIGRSNVNYEFVEGKALYQGLQCCFNLGEPGIYRVSSLGGETGSGYVVVLPDDVGNTLTINDYEYEPEYLVPREKDFVCVRNPYTFDRELKLTGTFEENIFLGSSTEVCSYDWANKKDNNISFEDLTTGGKFELKVIDSEILNIEVISNLFITNRGKINSEGTICFISKDDTVSEISVYDVFSNQIISGKTFELEGNSMKCFSNWLNDGLYKLTITQEDEESLIVIEDGEYTLIIGEENEGYIYESRFYGDPLIFTLEDFDNLFDIFVEKTEREIKINNMDKDIEYHLYSVISFNELLGFYTSSYHIQSPEIVFENTGLTDIHIQVLNYNPNLMGLESKNFVVEKESKKIYFFQEGDYRVEILSGLKEFDSVGGITIPDRQNERASIDGRRMIMFKEDEYVVDNTKKNFEIDKPIKFNQNLLFNVSTSQTQRVLFGYEDSDGIHIKDSFVIDSIMSKKSEIELQRMAGALQNLDFGVQVLNDVPTFEMLLDAKRLLAYDQSLPVFMYSRIGNIDVGIDNPFKTEVYNIPKDAEVSFVLSDWLKEEINQNKAKLDSDSTLSINNLLNNVQSLEEDITFTITTDHSSSEKNIIVRTVEPSKTIVMDYTEMKVVDDNPLDNPLDNEFKRYFVNNLAYEPRAFTFLPSQKDLCFVLEDTSSRTIDLGSSGVKRTASNMVLYDLNPDGPDNLNHISYHSSLYSESNIRKISDINVIYNYGVNVKGIELARDDGGDEEAGVLYLKADFDDLHNSPNDFEEIRFIEGYISGLDYLNFIRAYRFYGNPNIMELNVSPEVYENSYSVLARAFTDKKQTGPTHISNLLNVANVYLRAKDYKAVPNNFYMAGLSNTEFGSLRNAYHTYLKNKDILSDFESTSSIISIPGDHNEWVYTGCGDYVFVVPFNSSHIFQTFAYDVPVSSASSTALKNRADYIHTTNSEYQTVIHRVNSSVSFKIYNGEIINDIRLLLSENPTVADEICGYFNTSEPFKITGDFATAYSSSWKPKVGFKDNPLHGDNKDDFELNIHYDKIKNLYNKNNPNPNKNIIVYVPVGMFCGWGGLDNTYLSVAGSFDVCDGTNAPYCYGTFGYCDNIDCLGTHIATSANDLKQIQNNCHESDEYSNCFDDCISDCNEEMDCTAICRFQCFNACPPIISMPGIKTNVDYCYETLENFEILLIDECLLADGDDADDGKYNSCVYDHILDNNCSVSKVGENVNTYLKGRKSAFIGCWDEEKSDRDLINLKTYESECASFESIDFIRGKFEKYNTSRIWWCRSNIDAFGHETGMFSSGGDKWNFMDVKSLGAYAININDKFDDGIAFNQNLYHFIDGGYFDFYKMDSGVRTIKEEDIHKIATDRGKYGTPLSKFYTALTTDVPELDYDYGMGEDAFSYGLFFMINSVDTPEYFFSKEIKEDTSEFSIGYVLSQSFTVTNNNKKKMLCIGSDSFEGKDFMLGPGGKELINLDLKSEYVIYDPAFFVNLKIDDSRSFSHVSLFSRELSEDYSLGTFNFDKPVTNNFVVNEPTYGSSEVNIYLYNLSVKLETPTGFNEFDVIDLIEGESLILKNEGDSDIVWFFGDDDICKEDTFAKLLEERIGVSCGEEQGGYNVCLVNAEQYSINPSDVSEHLYLKHIEGKDGVERIVVPAGEEVEIKSDVLKVMGDDEYTEYLFYNPQTGKRFNVIISKESYVVDIDINKFNQDSVNILDNINTKLCLRNYHSTSLDVELVSKTNPSIKKTVPISPYSKECLSYVEIKNNDIFDPILKRELIINLEGFEPHLNENVLEVLEEITKSVTKSTRASYNPAYNFFELNIGASATPSVITTEIIDYNTINKHYACKPTGFIPICLDGHLYENLVDSVAEQVYTIVSNSRIEVVDFCDDGGTIVPISEGSLCTIDEDSPLPEGKTRQEIFDIESHVDCIVRDDDGEKIYDEEGNEVIDQNCVKAKQSAIKKIDEMDKELNPFTIINEDKVLTTLPILIRFNEGKTELTEQDVKNMKRFIDEVNDKVKELCEDGKCDNDEVNVGCGDSGTEHEEVVIKNRYLDMIGFVILIDDPGPTQRGNCSFLYNYLDGVMDVSIHAATTLDQYNLSMPSMVLGFGVNREKEATASCWSDLEFKKQFEDLFTTDFIIMLDKGIIGFGHYCLRDGECKPITTGIQNDDYGLYYTKEPDWSSFKPIIIEPIDLSEFELLPPEDKENCFKQGNVFYCDALLKGSVIPDASSLIVDDFSIFDLNLNLGNLPINIGGISGSGGSGIPSGPLPGVEHLIVDSGSSFEFNPILGEFNFIFFPDLLLGGIRKEPYGREWFDRCGRYYYRGEGMTMVVYPAMEVPQGQQGQACNPGKVMEIYKQFNC